MNNEVNLRHCTDGMRAWQTEGRVGGWLWRVGAWRELEVAFSSVALAATAEICILTTFPRRFLPVLPLDALLRPGADPRG